MKIYKNLLKIFSLAIFLFIISGISTSNVLAGQCESEDVSGDIVCGGSTATCSCPAGVIIDCYVNCKIYSCSRTGDPYCPFNCTLSSTSNDCGKTTKTCSCCTPGAGCDNCTPPACPVGYTTINPNNLCTTVDYLRTTCDNGNDDCGTACSDGKRSCYKIETNTTFIQSNGSTSGPTSVSITVDGTIYQLSTDPNNPTHIKLPTVGSSNVQLTVPTFTAPTTSRGGGYYFQVNNYGVNNEWSTWTTCSGVAGEDFCSTVPNTNNTQSFIPTTKTVGQVLKENATGKISAMYTTTDACTDTYKYSLPTEAYYIVDSLPITQPIVNPVDLIPDIATDVTTKGCSSTTYTGLEINNPLHIEANVTDTNNLDEIQSLILWFSKDTTVPKSMITTATCNTGYYYAAENVCCPDNTTYTNGSCVANPVASTCSASNSTPVSATQCCLDGTRLSGGTCTASTYSPTISCPVGYYRVSTNLCCPTGSTYDGRTCINPTSSPRSTIITCSNGGSYVSSISRCCQAGTYYNSTLGLCTDAPTPIICSTGYYLVSTSKCCPTNTTYVDGICSRTGVGTNAGATLNDVGIMIKKNGSNWSSPDIYSNDTLNNWRLVPTSQDGNTYIKIAGVNAIAVKDIAITQSTSVLFDFKMELLNIAGNMAGIYNVYTAAIDSFMIQGSTIDQSYISKVFDWGFDLVNPVVDEMTQQVVDATSINLTWNTSDLGSGLDKILINGYRIGGLNNNDAELFSGTVSRGLRPLISPLPDDLEIGIYTDPNAWTITPPPSGETSKLDIRDNESGKIDIYLTAYDKACNTNATSEDIDLNPWFATRGGSVYSKGSISTNAKDVSTSTVLDNVFSAKTAMTKERVDLGTELLSTRNTSITSLMHPVQGAVRTIAQYDSNSVKNYWYNQFVERFNKYRANATAISTLTTDVVKDCPEGTNCYLYSESATEDIHIPSGYICNKPTLIISARDIYIEPEITSTTTLSGCIFLAQNNIYIGAGDYKSTDTKIMYDYVEGFLIAENQIIVSLADTSKTLRDGLEIFGGAVALGSDISSSENALSIERNMKLFNQSNPTLVLTYDNKFTGISSLFFGTEAPLYRQEIGFKSF